MFLGIWDYNRVAIFTCSVPQAKSWKHDFGVLSVPHGQGYFVGTESYPKSDELLIGHLAVFM